MSRFLPNDTKQALLAGIAFILAFPGCRRSPMNSDAPPPRNDPLSSASPIKTYDDFRTALARPEFFFLEKPITFDDPWVDGANNAITIQLLQRIHAAWPAVIARAEREFRKEFQSDPEMFTKFEKPAIYMDEDDFADGGPFTKWHLVVGRVGQPDFGCHIEFSDSTFLKIWAGD